MKFWIDVAATAALIWLCAAWLLALYHNQNLRREGAALQWWALLIVTVACMVIGLYDIWA